jgi:hypothetical protein
MSKKWNEFDFSLRRSGYSKPVRAIADPAAKT